MDCSLRAYLLFLFGWLVCFLIVVFSFACYKACLIYSSYSTEISDGNLSLRRTNNISDLSRSVPV
ncbi:small hydrophobic protein p7 [Carnation necrotic fleck virus]|uniref:Small hydrophobic protein p7 n=1 Tax=Carnation necrotic fleck virus TaxID=551454 RepID=V5IV71_9CLOS|nr:small hydrophobic protein p7 [Carnation necrotic fleck virus]ADV40935.1 small hydrophobic protein p7 [Carnation necrotic fleck virus]